ncbi:MAG TPA: hypothetical protein VFP69_20135 [Streptomyces sp.]|nr:hypothetical protein [Streptomyces sp.]
MSSARRSLLTATAAGVLLGALWFVPSANASVDDLGGAESAAGAASPMGSRDPAPVRITASDTTGPAGSVRAEEAGQAADGVAEQVRLADTGSFDSTPYVVGGTLFLTLGAGFVVYSVRRERLGL